MTETPVTISGTFSKDSRPSNGLELISGELIKDQLGLHYVVGVVQFAGASVPGPNEPLVPRVKFLGIEPLKGSPADDAKRILDEARKARGMGRMEESIPAQDPTLFDFGTPGGEGGSVDEPQRVGEVRLTGDGPHVVPPPSAEEIQAERAEAKAAAKGKKPTDDPFTPDGAA